MTLKELQNTIKTPVFSLKEVSKLFPDEPDTAIRIQLARMVSGKDLQRIRYGLYKFPETIVDEFVLANLLYQPSYVSLETVLNNNGVIPDIVMNVTSVTTTTAKKIPTVSGTFLYSKISRDLYYGFDKLSDRTSDYHYSIACTEKALLDLIYIRRVKSLSEYRFTFDSIDVDKLQELAQKFPNWVKEVLNEQFKIPVS